MPQPWLWPISPAFPDTAGNQEFTGYGRSEAKNLAVAPRHAPGSRQACQEYVEDAESGELRRPHHIDLKSGRYRGKQILKAKED